MFAPKFSCLGARHVQVLILFGGIFMAYALRLNLSLAIVAMTDTSLENEQFVLNWSASEKGILLGMFFYGYVVSGIPSGLVANRFKTRYLLSAAGLACGLITVTFPLAAIYGGLVGSSASRIALGLVQGVIYPCTSAHLAKWSVPHERAFFMSLTLSGSPLGSTAMQGVAGVLAASEGGWPSVFYASGAGAILWSFLCFWFLRDSPREHGSISFKEINYIETNLVGASEKWRVMPIPWVSMFTSVPIWAMVVSACSYNWGFWTLETMLPTYISSKFHFKISENGFLCALPNLGMFVSSTLSPFVAHYFARRFHMSLTLQRRFWNGVAMFGGAICFTIVGVFNLDAVGVLVTLFIANVFLAITHVGYTCSFVDLAPNFAAIVMGFSNGVGQFAALLAPTLTGFIISDNATGHEWSIVFILASIIFAVGGAFFSTFGSAEKQPWNDCDEGD